MSFELYVFKTIARVYWKHISLFMDTYADVQL